MAQKKAIVTGATGFVGQFLVRELLRNGYYVYAVVRNVDKCKDLFNDSQLCIIQCEMGEYLTLVDRIKEPHIDSVFHVAWGGVSNEYAGNTDVQLQNIKATLDLIDVAHTLDATTFIGIGSIHEKEALSQIMSNKPISNPSMMYKTAKTTAHWMGKAKAGEYSMRFFWPQIINTYGEGEKSERLINSLIRKMMTGKCPEVSSGVQLYDFMYVTDVARALRLVAEKGIDGKEYVIGSGDIRPLKSYLGVLEKVCSDLSGTEVHLDYGKKTDNVICLKKEDLDSSVLSRDTGFAIEVPFDEGVRRTYRWIVSQENGKNER